jgi:hypothetical protein
VIEIIDTLSALEHVSKAYASNLPDFGGWLNQYRRSVARINASLRAGGSPQTVESSAGGGGEQMPITERILAAVPAGGVPQTLDLKGWTKALGLPARGANAQKHQSAVRMGFTNAMKRAPGRVSHDKATGTYTVSPGA